MGKEFLFDAALLPAVEFFDGHQLLGYLVKFLNAPAPMVQVGQIFDRIPVFVEQRGSENVRRSVNCVFNQTYAMVDCWIRNFFRTFAVGLTATTASVSSLAIKASNTLLAFSLNLNTG